MYALYCEYERSRQTVRTVSGAHVRGGATTALNTARSTNNKEISNDSGQQEYGCYIGFFFGDAGLFNWDFVSWSSQLYRGYSTNKPRKQTFIFLLHARTLPFLSPLTPPTGKPCFTCGPCVLLYLKTKHPSQRDQ